MPMGIHLKTSVKSRLPLKGIAEKTRDGADKKLNRSRTKRDSDSGSQNSKFTEYRRSQARREQVSDDRGFSRGYNPRHDRSARMRGNTVEDSEDESGQLGPIGVGKRFVHKRELGGAKVSAANDSDLSVLSDSRDFNSRGRGRNYGSLKINTKNKTFSSREKRIGQTGRRDRNKSDDFEVLKNKKMSLEDTTFKRRSSRGKLGHSKLHKRSGNDSTSMASDEDDSSLETAPSEDSNVQEETGDVVQEKHRRLPSRVLDKSGKKIRVNKKALESGSAEIAAPKKKKRVIKLDPHDISNKRLDDTPISSNNLNEEAPCADNQESVRAKFRAIKPTDSILSYVEENLIGRRRLIELQNAGYNVKLSAPLDNIPFSESTERERIEDNVFRNKLEFFAAAKVGTSFPPPVLPEIAFAGVSNVGKSSLLNSLTRQWGVARTSDTPGHTQTINFFRLASKLCLVDLPGYGYADAKPGAKETWHELVKEYVSTRTGLERVCLLIHTKRGMKPLDYELIDLMEKSQTPYQVVLTKTDIVFPIDVARRATEILEDLKNNKSIINPVLMVSSKSGAGLRNLRNVLAKLARFVKP